MIAISAFAIQYAKERNFSFFWEYPLVSEGNSALYVFKVLLAGKAL